jgi:uncharacterized protein (DUF608 family)
MKNLLEAFAGNAEFGSESDESSRTGRTWNAAISGEWDLEGGQTAECTVVFSWRFPNRNVNFAQNETLVPKGQSYELGNYYAQQCKSAVDVTTNLLTNLHDLEENTFRYIESLAASPTSVAECISANVSTLRTSVCMRTLDGRFYGFEGGCGAFSGGPGASGGCCPMNCTHVWNYDQTLVQLWPDLHRNMRETDWKVNQYQTGYLPHRTILPLALPRFWGVTIGGPDNPALDGLFAGILKTYQQFRLRSDDAWEKTHLPHARLAIEYAMRVHDSEADGVIRGEQPNTYDIHLYGPNTFIGTQYLAALEASAKMFPDIGDECLRRAESGATRYDELCWNGEYYQQIVEHDAYEHQFGEGCMSDQLLGEWWARLCGLGPILPRERVRQAAASIFRRNFKRSFEGIEQKPRQYALPQESGLLNCTYEGEQRPRVPLAYSDEVWSGIEYGLASLMLYEGMFEEANELVVAARARYKGDVRNPFNEIECGDHYVRPLSSFSLISAISGFQFDGRKRALSIRPNWRERRLTTLFVAGGCYGVMEIQAFDELSLSIRPAVGHLDVSELHFGLPEHSMGGWRYKTGEVHGEDANVDDMGLHSVRQVTAVPGKPIEIRVR